MRPTTVRKPFHRLCWVCQARIVAVLVLLLLAVKAFAEPVVPPSPPVSEQSTEDAPLADGTSQRSVPDYRGQKPPPTTAGDVLIWVPRVILLPAYLVTEYVMRAPVGGLATEAEKNDWRISVFNFFAFGPDHKGGIFPVFLFNFGFRPSIGAHFFWNDTFVAGNSFTADAAWGGSNWISVALGDRYHFSERQLTGRPGALEPPSGLRLLRHRPGDPRHLPLPLGHRRGRGLGDLHPGHPPRAPARGPARLTAPSSATTPAAAIPRSSSGSRPASSRRRLATRRTPPRPS